MINTGGTYTSGKNNTHIFKYRLSPFLFNCPFNFFTSIYISDYSKKYNINIIRGRKYVQKVKSTKNNLRKVNWTNNTKNKANDILSKSRSHLISKSPRNDHTIRLSRARSKNNPKPIQIIASRTSMHHFNSTTSQPKRHGPNGPTPGPIHQIIHFRDHELGRFGDARWRCGWRWARPAVWGRGG